MIIHYWAHLSFYCVSHAHQSTSSTTYRQSNIMRKATQIDPNKRKGQWILYHLTLRMAVSLLFYSPRVSIQATPAWSEEHCLGRGPKVEEAKLVMIDDLDNLLPILSRMRYTKVSNLGLTRACHVTCRKMKEILQQHLWTVWLDYHNPLVLQPYSNTPGHSIPPKQRESKWHDLHDVLTLSGLRTISSNFEVWGAQWKQYQKHQKTHMSMTCPWQIT